MTADMPEAELERARECWRRGAWGDAYQAFSVAGGAAGLAVDDLERLATAAYLTGHDIEFYRSLERAHHAHLAGGNQARAARCAFWLGLMLLLRGEAAQANGWLARAQRLVEGHDCVEHGFLLVPVAEQCLGERHADAALASARKAVEIGDRFGDADLVACARHLEGRAVIQRGQVESGLLLLDEAMLAVTRGELSPILTGLIYCSVIEACQQVFALNRAREWTSALGRWCEQQPDMVTFSGTCLLRRAEILQFRGAWAEALVEAGHAHERAGQSGGRKLSAEAFYRQAEIHRLRGEYAAAEEAYHKASDLGAEPQPGLALLRMAQGRSDAARAAIRRVLSATTGPLDRAKLLPAYVDIALGVGDRQDARAASGELDDIARRYPTDVLQAMANHVKGAVELADGRAQSALGALRHAFTLWQQGEAPHEAARVRLLIALACRELGDVESADLDFDAARGLFERLGATPDVTHLDELRQRPTGDNAPQLTPRELQVLRQVAAGKTNKAIAAQLSVSERTIDRHVSNILTKLGVPSRAAATAIAYQQKLL